MSDWNLFLDRKLEAGLTANEHQLVDAIARSTLGWRKRAERIGGALLRERSGLHDGRTFERARRGLEEKGLIRYTSPGAGGRGRRGLYEVILDEESQETSALERPFSPETSAETSAQTSALERRGEVGEGRDKNQSVGGQPFPSARRPINDQAVEQALAELIEDVKDPDPAFAQTLREKFVGYVRADDIYHAWEALERRRKQEPVDNEPGFVYRTLANLAYEREQDEA